MKLNCILPEESTDLAFTGWHTHAHTQKGVNPIE